MKSLWAAIVMGVVLALPSTGAAASKVVKANYTMPSCKLGPMKCAEVNLDRVVSDDPWITATMDRILYPPCWSDFDRSGKKNCTLQQDVSSFVAQSNAAVKMQTAAYSYDVTPTLLKDWGRLKQFSIASNLYTGGAHGNPRFEYVILDPKARKRVKLSDVVAAGQMNRLTGLVRERNRQRVLKEVGANELNDYMKTFPFEMTDNFVFDRTGLTFVFNVYEVAPYVSGPIEYTVPYSQLKGMLKADFYPTAAYLKSIGK